LENGNLSESQLYEQINSSMMVEAVAASAVLVVPAAVVEPYWPEIVAIFVLARWAFHSKLSPKHPIHQHVEELAEAQAAWPEAVLPCPFHPLDHPYLEGLP
jgi:hypothetical protein